MPFVSELIYYLKHLTKSQKPQQDSKSVLSCDVAKSLISCKRNTMEQLVDPLHEKRSWDCVNNCVESILPT